MLPQTTVETQGSLSVPHGHTDTKEKGEMGGGVGWFSGCCTNPPCRGLQVKKLDTAARICDPSTPVTRWDVQTGECPESLELGSETP